ncbi:MAG: discoidin domain-containing protein [Clostridiaceae bacterium]|nr:discoidin domain-containing protein [Clostridiaceae bacterium]
MDRIYLSWQSAYATAFQLQTSKDGSSWTQIYSTTSGTGGINDLNVTGGTGGTENITVTVAKTGRYVRMNGTARTTGYGYSLWGFEVYGIK